MGENREERIEKSTWGRNCFERRFSTSHTCSTWTTLRHQRYVTARSLSSVCFFELHSSVSWQTQTLCFILYEWGYNQVFWSGYGRS